MLTLQRIRVQWYRFSSRLFGLEIIQPFATAVISVRNI